MRYVVIIIFLLLLSFGCVCLGLNQFSKPVSLTNGSDDSVINESSQPTPPDDSCSSSSDCGYKEKCKNKKCVQVECTTDSQCSGCKRCSNNECVSCGSGPYGCYC